MPQFGFSLAAPSCIASAMSATLGPFASVEPTSLGLMLAVNTEAVTLWHPAMPALGASQYSVSPHGTLRNAIEFMSSKI